MRALAAVIVLPVPRYWGSVGAAGGGGLADPPQHNPHRVSCEHDPCSTIQMTGKQESPRGQRRNWQWVEQRIPVLLVKCGLERLCVRPSDIHGPFLGYLS